MKGPVNETFTIRRKISPDEEHEFHYVMNAGGNISREDHSVSLPDLTTVSSKQKQIDWDSQTAAIFFEDMSTDIKTATATIPKL